VERAAVTVERTAVTVERAAVTVERAAVTGESSCNCGESSCNCGDGTGQMAQPLMFMMMMTFKWMEFLSAAVLCGDCQILTL
jgi:hypothetical protein